MASTFNQILMPWNLLSFPEVVLLESVQKSSQSSSYLNTSLFFWFPDSCRGANAGLSHIPEVQTTNRCSKSDGVPGDHLVCGAKTRPVHAPPHIRRGFPGRLSCSAGCSDSPHIWRRHRARCWRPSPRTAASPALSSPRRRGSRR